MDPALSALVDLQKILNEQAHLRRRRRDIPKETEAIQADLQATEKRLEERQEALQDLISKERRCERDLSATEQALEKKQATLHEVKNNKEYTAALHEIESLKAKKSSLEEETLVLMEKIAEEKGVVAEDEKAIHEERKGLEALSEYKTRESGAAQARLLEIEKLLPDYQSRVLPTLLDRFKKLYYNKNGNALVPVSDDACAGCQVALSPQMTNAVRAGDRIVTCDHCGRILYNDDGQS